MCDNGDRLNNNWWNQIPDDCLRFHLPFQKLCRECVAFSEQLRTDYEAASHSNEALFHQTMEATLKLYQGITLYYRVSFKIHREYEHGQILKRLLTY